MRLEGAPDRSAHNRQLRESAQGRRGGVQPPPDSGGGVGCAVSGCSNALDDFERRCECRSRRRAAVELQASLDRYRGAEGGRRRARLRRPAAAARDLVRDNAEVRRDFQDALHAHLRRRVSGHRSAAGRDPAPAAGADDAVEPRLAKTSRPRPASSSSSATRSSRSTGSAAPTSASTSRSASGSAARGASCVQADDELPRRAGDPACRERRVRAADDRRRATRCRPDYVPLTPHRAPTAGSRPSLRCRCREPYGSAERRQRSQSSSRCPMRSARSSTGCSTRAAGRSPSATAHETRCRSRPRHVCLLFRRFTSFGDGHHARLRPGARSARHPAPAGRRQVVSRPRRGRDPARGADRDRVAGRRAVGVRHAARVAVRDRRRGAAEYRAQLRALPSVSACRRASAGAAGAGWRGADAAARRCIGAATAGRSPTRSASCSRRRARTPALRCGPAASRRWPTCCTSPIWRARTRPTGGISFRGFVEELSEAAEAGRGAGSADARRGQRRRPADDRAQGQGARVSGRDPGRHHRESVARHEPIATSIRDRNLCALRAGGLGAVGSAGSRAAGGGSRQARGRHRVAYVAATRARDLLVVPAVGDGSVHRRLGRAR